MRKSSLFLALIALLTGFSLHGATESYIDFGAPWRFKLGTNEASSPDLTAWRLLGFNDSTWSSPAPTPIGYGDPIPATVVTNSNLTTPNWLCLFMRRTFVVNNPAALSSVLLSINIDDGYVVWINGTEVGRFNMPGGEPTIASAAITAGEPVLQTHDVATNLLQAGNNIIAIQAFNANTTSSDLYVDVSLVGAIDNEAPFIVSRIPTAGLTVQNLVQIEVDFNEPVIGVDAADLRINSVPATGLLFGAPGQFVFEFAPAPTGLVSVTFAPLHGITDLAPAPNAFAGATWNYTVDPNINPGTFRISEFLASNDNGLHDEDGDSSDWIEILNPAMTANLQGWYLTDDPLDLTKWRFPYYVLNGNNYLVVFASGKNRTNVLSGGRLHTSFQINSGGGYLALVDPDTNVVSKFDPYPDQSVDVSYGRDEVNPNLVGSYTTPTPGQPNSTRGDGFAPEVTFSHSSRTFSTTAPFPLVLTTPGVSNATLYYAHGTNLPGTNTFRYTNALNISTTAVIRARAFVPGKLPGPVKTMSFIALSPTTSGAIPGATNVLTFNSALPIIILHNYGQGQVPANSEAEQHVLFQVFDNDCGRCSMTNLPNLTGRGIFHSRGSSTLASSGSKASFFFEVRDEISGDRAVPLLGLPEESDWILYSPNGFEPALYHNPLAHQLFRDKGRYGSRTRFFELYLQDDTNPGGAIVPGDYHGIYVLEEKIKRDKARVDIARLDIEDVTLPSVTGGYAMSIDRPDAGEAQFSAGGTPLNWVEPNGDDMTNILRNPQKTYITDYLNTFNATLNGANWTNPVIGYQAYIDVDSWIDLHTHEVLTFNVDAMRLSGYFYKDRNRKLSYGPTWDYDRTQGSTDGRDANPRIFASSGGTDFFNFSPWWGRLLSSPDFWQAWIDRWQDLREGTNAYSTTNVLGRILQFYDALAESQPREKARWNIGLRTSTGGSGGTYLTETQWKINWYTNRLNYIDLQFLSKASFNTAPGPFSNTLEVIITPVTGVGDRRAGSQLFVSLDGTDPRLPSGGFATGPNVLSNTGPITISVSNSVRLFARCRNTAHVNVTGALNPPISSPWSGPIAGTFYFPAQTPPMRVTEIMYHPPDAPPGNATNDANNFEYLELKNISAEPLNVTGFRLRGGIEFDFPSLMLTGGQSCVVVADVAGFQSRYGTGALIAGAYTNKPTQNRLGNGGDHIKLEGAVRQPILDFEYSDDWYPTTDGAGFALQIVDENLPTSAWGLKSSWRPSGKLLGTPGTNDSGAVPYGAVVINEILTHPTTPAVDAIELFNLTGTPVNVGGWFLTDDFNVPKRYRIPDGTTVPDNGYLVLYANTSFGGAMDLSSRGEEIYLFSGDGTNLTGYVHGFDYGAQAKDVTFGRYLTSGGTQYPAQAAPSLGSPNTGPNVGPIVISEIMYHPADVQTAEGPRNNEKDEYIELENITTVSQPLFDPMAPTNTWRLRDAVSFTFPTNVMLPVGGHILVVSFDPEADPWAAAQFRSRNGAFQGAPLFGPFEGHLDNSGDRVELVRPDRPQPPDAPDANAVYYILADKVNYSDTAPWPAGADGFGFSLQRIVPGGFGNDPTNWNADLKTPGGSYGGGNGPVITLQPSNVTILGTLTATFSLTATGEAPIFYQWFSGASGIPSATNPVLTLPNVSVSQSGEYRCLVQNNGGGTFSSNATLTVLAPPNIIQQPANVSLRVPPDTGALANRGATFRVNASTANPPLSYQWRVNGTNVPAGTPDILGINSSTLNVTNVVFSQAGVYSCAVTDGNGTIYSANAVLGVLPFMLSGSQPMTVPEGADISVSAVVQAYPAPFLYSWRRATPVNTNIVSNSGTNFATWNSTAAGYVLINNILSSNFSLRLVFTNLTTTVNGQALINNNNFITLVADTDRDGIPNSVESELGLDPLLAADGGGDLDGDGMTNGDEYRAGTDPADPSSYLRVDLSTVPGQATVRFGAVSNRTYSVQYADSLPAPFWTGLADVLALNSNRVESFVDPAWTTNRVYRTVTPRQQ